MTMGYNHFELPTVMGIAGKTFVGKVDYSPMGDVLRTEAGPAGSQLYSTSFYDEQTRRLTRQVHDREKAPGRISDTSYEYDTIGNILKVTDKEGPSGSATTDTQCFAYDYMRRMSEAWTATDGCAAKPGAAGPDSRPKVGGPNPYWSSYSFDAAGNRTKEVQHSPSGEAAKQVTRDYKYGTPGKPGANRLGQVTTTGPQGVRSDSFTYDDAGNTDLRTVQGNTQDFERDTEGRLAKVTEGSRTTEYVYDGGGNRLIKRDPSGSTLYLPGTEVKLTPGGKVEGTRYYANRPAPSWCAPPRTARSPRRTCSRTATERRTRASTRRPRRSPGASSPRSARSAAPLPPSGPTRRASSAGRWTTPVRGVCLQGQRAPTGRTRTRLVQPRGPGHRQSQDPLCWPDQGTGMTGAREDQGTGTTGTTGNGEG
ncbi:hypothetical protein [Streptomyces bambusae]|uniref:RHS repeat protein n=1 Tax=Streptomyces bambusae TaxID=1550616 RepID=A0ABS6Z4S1_9ACTN|nr:hypothetical protein [Streptomyces bambusae]MBW5482770.1 hypothetical protein [Streptomyces bambusae]